MNPPDDSTGSTAGEVTRLLQEVRSGSGGAEEALIAAVYADLRLLASARMRSEAGPRTLQATALVHEAWLRLSGASGAFEDRRHFFGAAARVMRQILVDRYRREHRIKRGGDGVGFVDIDGVQLALEAGAADLDLVALGDALDALEAHDPRMAQIVHLKFFVGLSVEETAETLELSPRTIKREWAVARAWLFQRMS